MAEDTYDEGEGEDAPPHTAFAEEVELLAVDLVKYKPKSDAAEALRGFAHNFFLPVVRRVNECMGGSLDEVFETIDGLQQQLDALSGSIGNVLAVAQANALGAQLAHSVLAGAPAEQTRALAEAYAAAVTTSSAQLQALVAALAGLQEQGEEAPESEAAAPEPEPEPEVAAPRKPVIPLPGLPTSPIAAKS